MHVVMLSVIMLSVIILSVAAPSEKPTNGKSILTDVNKTFSLQKADAYKRTCLPQLSINYRGKKAYSTGPERPRAELTALNFLRNLQMRLIS